MQNLNLYAKSLLLGTFMLLVIYNSMAQVPQTVPYQAVARNTSGNLLANQTVSIRFSIHDTTSGGLVVYQETQSTTTNALGLFTANIGAGTPVTGSFAAINWGSGSKFIQIEIDLSGGSSYANMGTSQMMSVPYAQYAASSGTVTGIVPVANGGTGSATKNFVDLTTAQTVAGIKTFSSDVSINGITIGKGAGSIETNTANGSMALSSNTTGELNTAIGALALMRNTTGTYNTAIGAWALALDSTGINNTAIGAYALVQNTTGINNTAIGALALVQNTTGSVNTAIGHSALMQNTTGTYNTAIGIGADVASGALFNATAIGSGAVVDSSNTIQLGNTAVTNVKTSGTITAGDVTYPNTDGTTGKVLTANGSGTPTWAAGGVPYTGATDTVDLGAYDLTVNGLTVGKGHLSVGDNTAIGNGALHSNTTGDYNTAAGAYSLASNTTGYSNTAAGQGTLNSNTEGHNNTANGVGALNSNTTGNQNTATGQGALQANLTGSFNTVSGVSALELNTTGSSNTAIGVGSLSTNTSGSSNTAIGIGADVASGALFNATAIGAGAIGTASNTIQLGNIEVTNVKTSGTLTAGEITYPNTAGTSGDILTTNGTTTASWARPGSFSWGLTGNTGTDSTTNFIGTTDNKALVFKVNSEKAGEVSSGTNTSFGYQTLNASTGTYNTANGYQALFSNISGYNNTANGAQALYSNISGGNNTANGGQALVSNTSGGNNTAIGNQALSSNTTGYYNTANGVGALTFNTTGTSNTANGYNAGNYISNGSTANATSSQSVYLGASTKASASGDINEIVIGYNLNWN